MCRALIVEDSKTFRTAFKRELVKRFPDMRVAIAADGAEALKKMGGFDPHIVFMDIRLPGENGLALTEKIKTRNPDVIIVILTDYDLPEYREAAMKIGADRFIPKGALNLAEIGRIVDDLVTIGKADRPAVCERASPAGGAGKPERLKK